jgi:hypothetical protein
MLEGRAPRLMIVVTHRDLHVLEDKVAERLRTELNRHGAEAEIVGVAPFSDQPDNVPAGFGLAELVNLTIGTQPDRPTFWRSTQPAEGGRAYLSYRRGQ